MAAVREIPGMYYDEDLGKYFKIQPHHVAPKGAKYTKEAISNQIKAKARKDQQERHSRYMAVFNPIRRERTLRSTTATGYMLHRSLYPGLQLPKPHLWSAGIRFKHCTQVWTPNEPSRSRVVQQLAPLCPDSYVIVASDEVSATITIHRYGESEIAAASGEQFPNVTASVIRPDYFVVASDEVVTVGLPVIRDDGGLSYLDHGKSNSCRLDSSTAWVQFLLHIALLGPHENLSPTIKPYIHKSLDTMPDPSDGYRSCS